MCVKRVNNKTRIKIIIHQSLESMTEVILIHACMHTIKEALVKKSGDIQTRHFKTIHWL